MLKTYLFSFCLFLLLSFSSCEKTTVDPATLPEINFGLNIQSAPGVRSELDSISNEFTIPVATHYKFKNLSSNLSDFRWDFGDGQTSKEKSPQLAYSMPGTYTVNLQGKDRKGQVHSIEKTIVVKEHLLKRLSISGFKWDGGFGLPEGWDHNAPTDVVFEIWSIDTNGPWLSDSGFIGDLVYRSEVLKDVPNPSTTIWGVKERVPVSVMDLRFKYAIALRGIQDDLSVIFLSNMFSGISNSASGYFRAYEWKTGAFSNQVILYLELDK